MSAHDTPLRNADLAYRLRSLSMAGAVLHVGSHPDDEEAGLMAYLSRGLGVRTVYWSATRGEGGQNRAGPEREEALGILRTWESLEARDLDGGEVLYGPFYDFGFSRSGQDALERWDRSAVAREIVRAIRLVQPQVVVSRWTGGPEDGHGHHQAVGMVVGEAFDSAGDPARFPELIEQGLPPWQPRKLYRSALGDWQPGEERTFGNRRPELERRGALRINTGAFDRISGRSFQELAWIGVNRHRSQAMAFLPRRGDYFSYYVLDRSGPASMGSEGGFFDGLDPTLPGLADVAGAGASDFRKPLEEARDYAVAAVAALRADRPAAAGRSVLDGLGSLRRATQALADTAVDDHVRQALQRSLDMKIREFEETAGRCLGIDVECQVDAARLTPGSRVLVRARVWDAGDREVSGADVRLEVPEGWTARRIDVRWGDEEDSELVPVVTGAFDVTVPENAALSAPYWLQEPRTPYRYAWPARGPVGLPFDEPLVSVTCDLEVDDHRMTIRRPAIHRETFAGGSRELPLEVVPPMSLSPREQRVLLQATGTDQRVQLQLAVRSMRDDVSGTLAVDAPAGWEVQPAEVELSFHRPGELRTLWFEVRIPSEAKPGVHEIGYRVRSGARGYGLMLQPVRRRAPGLPGPADETNCIAEAFVTAPAAVSVHLIDAEFVRRLKYGYIRGADEGVMSALARFRLDLTVLDAEELSYADLSAFDTIVVGPNAYLVSDGVRRNATRLLEYVEHGGTLIVQYQAYGYQRPGNAPYPFRFRQPHDRVTIPDAPVAILDPDHAVLSVPNRIVAEDFNGWTHDRGLYFFGEWDKRYEPLLASGDPGQEPQQGGLLVARYGRGNFVYSGYSFFRQIPEGVPGAVRLFANILGLAEATILERVERVKGVPLLSFLDESQLYEVARLMSEQWLDPGSILCRQGDRGDELYVLLDGQVEVLKRDPAGERVVFEAGPGEVVGELAVLTDLPRSATLRAKDDLKILLMRGPAFREFIRQHPDLSDRLASMLAQRLSSSEIMW